VLMGNIRKFAKVEADKLITDYGDRAYETVREAMRKAHRRGGHLSERYFAKVAVEIARRSGREIGADTATRYLEK
jgi:hypothetical protein